METNIDISNSDISNDIPDTNKIDFQKLCNLNHITLEYFSNTGFQNKINKTGDEPSISKSDKKFYKKRIINETKKMLKDEFQNDVVKTIFNKYIFSLINHFKIVDTNELLQKEFIDEDKQSSYLSNILKFDISNNLYIKTNDISENNIDSENENENETNLTDISNCNPNELLFKQNDCKILTMDNFINKKSKQKEKVNFPLKRNINLREPELKMKGIQKKLKKENIDNV